MNGLAVRVPTKESMFCFFAFGTVLEVCVEIFPSMEELQFFFIKSEIRKIKFENK